MTHGRSGTMSASRSSSRGVTFAILALLTTAGGACRDWAIAPEAGDEGPSVGVGAGGAGGVNTKPAGASGGAAASASGGASGSGTTGAATGGGSAGMGGGVGGAGGLPGPGGVPGTGGAGGKPSEAPDAQATGNGGSTAAPDAGRDATLGADATPAAPPKGPSAGCGKPTPTLPLVRRGGSTKPQLSFMARAEARTAIVRIPAGYSPDKQYPLVILFHGYGNQGEEVDGQLGSYAPARSAAVIVSPDGLDRVNSGKPAWWDTRDVPVFDEVTAWAKANLCIDLARVFIAGVSNGASMVNTIACARGDSIRGLGVVAGSLPAMNNCQRSVAMVGVHSPMDTEVPVASGIKSRDYWRRRNLCADKALMPTPCDSLPGCAPGLPVAWCEHGEGVYQEAGAWTYHGWARAANEAVWGFFSKL